MTTNPTHVRPGMTLCSLDPRDNEKKIVVLAVVQRANKNGWFACYQSGSRRSYISTDRIYPQYRSVKSGWYVHVNDKAGIPT